MAAARKGCRNLDVWQRAMDLVEAVYAVTRLLPDSERFGLISQMQRAAVSAPSNIAEGYGRGGRDYRRFVMMARGSVMELETQIEITVRLKLLSREEIREAWDLSQGTAKMLSRLADSLKGR